MGPMRASRTPGTTHTGHLCQLETWSWRPTREGHRTHDTVTDGLTKQATRRGASRLESPVRRPPHTPRLFSRWNTISGLWGPTTRETALLTPVAHTWLTVATRQARQSHTTHRVQHRAHSRSIWIVRALQAPGILRPRRPPSVTPSRSRKPQQLSAHAHGRLSNSVHTRGADHWRSLPQGGGRRVHSSRLLLYSSDSASWPVHSLATICHSSDSASLEGSLTTAV